MHREPQEHVADPCMDSGVTLLERNMDVGDLQQAEASLIFTGERLCLIPQGCTLQTLGETELPRTLGQKWSGPHILGV